MNEYFLSKGAHSTAADGRCAMEWVSYLAGEQHTDQPVCVGPVLKTFCISFNDALDDKARQRLRPYLARTIGTAGDGLDQKRAEMCLDWLVRVYTPAWLDLVPSLRQHAEALRAMPEGLVVENTARAMEMISAARKDAAAAWDAAGTAAAGAAAWAAARDAAWAAARAAARDAVGAATWDAVGAAAWDAAGAAARAAARDATRDAALEPTVKRLQDSAFDLLDRMLPTELVQLPVVDEYEAFLPAGNLACPVHGSG